MGLKQRVALAVALTIGFYALALAIVVLLLAVPVLEDMLLHQVTIRLAIFCVAGAGIVLWSILPRRASFVAPGPPLLPAQQPRLFGALADVARLVGEPMPAEVYLVPDVNAAVTEVGGTLGIGRRRIMMLGLPLLQVLSVSELRAVLAHELGHYAGGDTALGPWIYRTREAIGRTLGALRGRSSMLHLPFAFYSRLFLRVTQAVSRRQEFAADELAARTIGARPLAGALRSLAGASIAYGSFWREEFGPALDAGCRPPLAEGFAAFLDQPRVYGILETAVDQRLAEPRRDPYDSHPPDADRIAALERLPQGDGQGGGAPALELLADLPRLEAELIGTVLVPGTAAPSPITWADVPERALVPQWEARGRRTGACLGGATVAMLPQLMASLEGLGGCMGRALGFNGANNERARAIAVNLLGSDLALALRRAGWAVDAPPGAPVTMRWGERSLDPFDAVKRLASEELDGGGWAAACARLGIADGPLAPPGTEQEPIGIAPRPGSPQPWLIVTRNCTTSWLDWRTGELLLSSEGLLRRRRSFLRSIGASVSSYYGEQRGVVREPVWLGPNDVKEIAARHHTNVWVPKEAISRARLRRGIQTSSLRLELSDGRRVKLLYPPSRSTDAALRGWLGPALVA